jgi:hypothetical protein
MQGLFLFKKLANTVEENDRAFQACPGIKRGFLCEEFFCQLLISYVGLSRPVLNYLIVQRYYPDSTPPDQSKKGVIKNAPLSV